MEIPGILAALDRYNGAFPREALEEAVRRREEITPELLRILEYTVVNAKAIGQEEEDGSYFAYMYAIYLLAQFRETRAYPLVVQFARLPEEILGTLVSDFITEGLDCVLASVCGGDTNLIEEIIEDPNVEEYVRGAAIHSLLCLVAAGDKTRDEVMAYFKALFDGRLGRTFSQVWNSLVSCATDLYPDEVYDRIVAAYEEGLVEPFAIRIQEVDEVMALDRQTVLDKLPTGAPVYIQDVIEEMEDWACFNPPKRPKQSKRVPAQGPKRQPFESLFFRAVYPNPPKFLWPSIPTPKVKPVPQQPEITESRSPKPLPKVKPNDRCPCGSGKKFKKCCGRIDVAPAKGEFLLSQASDGQHDRAFTTRGKVEKLDPRRDAEYIIGKAQEGVTCVVGQGALVYFSTETGDAWMLDVEDHFALCLAKDGDRLPFRIMETSKTFKIEWNADYQINGETFTVFDRSGRVRSILGYPTDAIERTTRSAGS